ncbi:MAG: aldose 1-epimerase, partial [Pseudomonadota bacterium]
MILRGGDIELELTPRGGCVAALTWRGIDVLRRGAADAEALQQGAFPMAPFSGRIGSGRFVFAGRQIELPKNFPPEPHAIHGFSWTATWSSAAISERSQRLTHDYDGADWPWPYRAEQVFSLIEDGLELSLSLQNSSADEMPAGFGWHPYFPSDGAEIEADVREIWPSGDSMIPAEPELLSAP